jgi:hypothetical protein
MAYALRQASRADIAAIHAVRMSLCPQPALSSVGRSRFAHCEIRRLITGPRRVFSPRKIQQVFIRMRKRSAKMRQLHSDYAPKAQQEKLH